MTATDQGFEWPAIEPDSRDRAVEGLASSPLDVLVLGGGINGAGIARDLALRARTVGMPLRIGLVEQAQFGSGTSGRNSQLIHGGLRYLKQLRFHLVREALAERRILLGLAPHLVEPLAFLMPLRGLAARLYYGAGLWLYDALAGSARLAPHEFLPPEEVARREPGLAPQEHFSAAVFHDARVCAARFVLANVFDAVRNGVLAANYVRAGDWSRERGGFRVALEDLLSGRRFEVRTRYLVDATGPWSKGAALRLVRGSHLVLPRMNSGGHAIAWFESGGRIVFFLPWGSGAPLTLVGTTDIDHAAGPENVHISPPEARYLLGVAKRLFPQAALEPVAAYSALRPLVAGAARSPTALSREHRIWNSPDGVLHIAGGKYTTYRAMSEEAADRIALALAPRLRGVHVTAATPLEGNTPEAIERALAAAPDSAARYGLSPGEAVQAVRDYGLQSSALLALLPGSAPSGLSRLQCARIAFAVRYEMARRLTDLVFVSTYWGYERRPDSEWLPAAAGEMASQLGWSGERMEREMELVRQAVRVPEAA